MKKTSSLTLFILLSPVLGLCAAMTINKILDRVEKAQTGTKAFSADYEETISMRASLQSQKLTGHVLLERPSNLYLTIKEPVSQTVVSDGKTGWLYMPEQDQVVKQDLSASPYFKQFEFILGNEAKVLKENYLITKIKDESLDGMAAHVIKLAPKSKGRYYFEVKLWFAEPDWLPMKTQAYLTNGSSITMRLKNIKLNPAIKPGQFTFKPPPGTDIIDGDQLLKDMGMPVKEKGK